MGVDIPAHLRDPENALWDQSGVQHVFTPHCLIWSGIQLAQVLHAHLIVIPLPVAGLASLKPPCTGQQAPHTTQQA